MKHFIQSVRPIARCAMKRLKCLVSIAFCTLLTINVVSYAQDTGTILSTPDSAAATAGGPTKLRAGQSFDFTLQFGQAPEGYHGGEIRCEFRRESSSDDFPQQSYQESAIARSPLHDGQAIYLMSLPVGSMRPGLWKLVAVTVGEAVQKPVPISEHVSLEVLAPEADLSIHLDAPHSVRAGQKVTVKIMVDKYPPGLDPNCTFAFSLIMFINGPTGTYFGPQFEPPSVEIKAGQSSYEMSRVLESDFPSGTWRLHVRIEATQKPQLGSPISWPPCNIPSLGGMIVSRLIVEPDIELVTPSSVAVTVNPPQIKLLLTEAERLRTTAQDIERQLSTGNADSNQALLRNSVRDAFIRVAETEATFKQQGIDRATVPAVNTFFDDIRSSYSDALKVFVSDSTQIPKTAHLEEVLASIGNPASQLNTKSEAVIKSILHNANAYDIAAASKELTFSLDVYSEPQGATIAYKLRGDEYHPLDHETDWHIENLPRAVYTIRLQKAGYLDKEVTYDAIDSTDNGIHVQLERQHGAR